MPVQYIPHPLQANYTNPVGRALNTVYQNLTLRPIMVLVTCWHVVGNIANTCRVIAYIGVPNPPVTWVGSGGHFVPGALSTTHSFLTFLVPPGWRYRVVTNDGVGNASQLNLWDEIEL